MIYPETIREAEKRINEGLRFFEEAQQELDHMKQEYKKFNRTLPRKEVAQIIGCTPSHVSRLKADGKLRSYRINDVLEYSKKN
jgi:DNA-directed RNA polymerase specialized sigma subunit